MLVSLEQVAGFLDVFGVEQGATIIGDIDEVG
jgi:hypothetical protein